MRPFRRSRQLRALGRDQSGLAVPTALMALIATFGLASVAVLSTVDVQQGTSRDLASKEAIAAADAGANVAMLRLNRFVSRLTPTTPCIGPNGETQSPSGTWCPQAPTESTGAATYHYSVSAYSATAGVQVVSTGTAARVTRRVAVSLFPEPGHPVFEGEPLIGEEGIEFNGSSAVIETNMGTNGNITTSGSSHPKLCGSERKGYGKEAPTPSCEGVVTEGSKLLPPVVPPTGIETINANCRLSNTCANHEFDTVSKEEGGEKASNGAKFNATTRELTLSGGAVLSMGGENYWLCKLIVKSGTIIMPVGAHVHIYIDTPEHCGLPAGAMQVEFQGNSTIKSTGWNPSQGFYEVPGIYVVGNGGVSLAGNSGADELMLYAPLSRVELAGSATWTGMIAGKALTIKGNPTVTSNEHIKQPPVKYAALLQRTRYVECSGTATALNAGC